MTKFLVLIAAPGGKTGTVLSQADESDFLSESSASFNFLEFVNSKATQAANSHSDSDVMVGDVKVNFATMEASRLIHYS